MSDWKAVTDPNTGRIYYANLVTRETRWDPPPGFQDSNQQPITYSPDNQVNYQQNNYQQNNYQQSFYGNQQNQYQQQQQQSFYQPQQQSFYGNQQNQYQQQQQQQQSFYQQQQQPQQSFYQPQQQQQQQQQQQLDDSNSDWKAAFDDNTGKYYYYNEKTGQTQWHMPDELKQQQKTKKLPPTPNKQKPKQNSYQNKKQPQQYEQQINKLNKEKAEQAVKFGQQSVYNIQTGWDSSEDDEDEDDDNGDSWNDNSGNEEESSSGDDGLEQVVNGGKKKDQGQTHVITDPSSSESDMDQKNDNPFGNDEDEVLVEDDSDKYWTIGETQGQKFKMNDYADKYFQKDKHKKGLFKKQSVQEMLQWAPYSNVKHAFRKLDSKLNTQAKQTWKNICSYMGDRKSSKKSEGHIDKLLKYALKAPEELRDEIYIQIMKQTNKNPKKQSLMQGWRLLSIICSIFPPSDEFACYVAVYLFQQSKEAGDVGDCATFALKALDRTMAHGQRKMQPSPDEIQRIEHREPIHIKVWFLDRTFRVLLVTSQTKASQVEKALADAFRMRHPESFGLFEMEEPKPGWANEVYKKREQMDRQAKIDALQHLPFDRELEVNERIMDVMASWKRSKKKKDRKLRFVYKCKLFSKAQEGEYSRQGWKVAFITAVWHVRHELYPINEDHSFKLGALQLQATHGLKEQKDFYAPGVLIADVKDYVPYQLLNKYNDKQLESNILKYHNAYKHLDKPDAYRKYIEIIRGEACPTYFGLTFFRCVRVSRLRKQKTNEQEDLLIGIGETGVLFLHPTSLKVIERYKMEEILTYGFRSNAFLFVAGTLMTQRKYQFATMLGKQMNDLLRAHIDLRVQQAEVQGYNLMN